MNTDKHDVNATIAVFLDLENIAIGAQEAHFPRFDIQKILERLLLKGHIVVKKAYCDFDRYKEFKRDLHETAFELIEIPHVRQSGKNIRMVVDALDLCYSRSHINAFVIASGDSDFSPLVSKLRENNKLVIGVGVKNSTSDLLLENCDEFIFYEDLLRGGGAAAQSPAAQSRLGDLPKKKRECFELLVDAILALERENKDVLWGSMVKQTMQRKKPTFNE